MALVGKTCLDIYRSVLQSIWAIKSINYTRSFFIYWIESSEWKSLKETKNEDLFNYLETEYPIKISKIRNEILD